MRSGNLVHGPENGEEEKSEDEVLANMDDTRQELHQIIDVVQNIQRGIN